MFYPTYRILLLDNSNSLVFSEYHSVVFVNYKENFAAKFYAKIIIELQKIKFGILCVKFYSVVITHGLPPGGLRLPPAVVKRPFVR